MELYVFDQGVLNKLQFQNKPTEQSTWECVKIERWSLKENTCQAKAGTVTTDYNPNYKNKMFNN